MIGRIIVFSAIILLAISSPAEAKKRHRHLHHGWKIEVHSLGFGPRPGAWCGWYMRTRKGVTDPRYNLARNWMHYGSPAGGPGVGVIVVWPHHVGEIVGRTEKGWIVHSGNDGHRVRDRVRSLAGVIAYRS